MMTREQVDVMFRQALLRQIAKIDAVVAAEKSDPSFDVEQSIREDMRWHWTWRWLAARGCAAEVDDKAASTMRSAGLSEEDIFEIAFRLEVLRRRKMVPTPSGKLEILLAAAGADPTEVNIAVAQQSYFRAMSQASAISARVQREGPIADEAAAEAIVRAVAFDASPQTVPKAAPVQMVSNAAVLEPPPRWTTDDIVALGEKLIAQKARDENWDDKLQRQNRQTYALFARFVSEETPATGFAGLKQEHIAAFTDFLSNEIYRYYGKSEKDGDLSIAQLRRQGKDKQKEAMVKRASNEKAAPPVSTRGTRRHSQERDRLIGLEGTTLNRHLTGLSQLLAYARNRGVPIVRDIDVSELRAQIGKKKKRKRDQRLKLPLNASVKVFRYAPFVGCEAWDRPYKPGPFTYHRALYFAPMILEYTGCRLEEAAGLAVEDVILDPIPQLHFRDNEFRRIKNPSSDRLVPIHDELIRLGFLEYVARIKELGYRCIFPDLCSPSPRTSMGARLYKEFRRLLTWACEEHELSTDHDLHSIRHGFDTRLKEAGVPEEYRQDLMGHEGKSETSARYADALSAKRALDTLNKLPILTAHLQPRPIQLLPWIEARQEPPFARRRRPRVRVGA